MQDLSIIKLTEAAKARDPDAFTQLIRMHMTDMYRAAIAILRNDEDAADAVQDAILACWEKLETLQDPGYFRTWLIRILIRKCYDIRRQSMGITSLEEAPEPAAEDYSDLEWREALDYLEEPCRIVVALYYGMGYKGREIAKILGIPPGTVRQRLKRSRQKLRAYYEAEQRGQTK